MLNNLGAVMCCIHSQACCRCTQIAADRLPVPKHTQQALSAHNTPCVVCCSISSAQATGVLHVLLQCNTSCASASCTPSVLPPLPSTAQSAMTTAQCKLDMAMDMLSNAVHIISRFNSDVLQVSLALHSRQPPRHSEQPQLAMPLLRTPSCPRAPVSCSGPPSRQHTAWGS